MSVEESSSSIPKHTIQLNKSNNSKSLAGNGNQAFPRAPLERHLPSPLLMKKAAEKSFKASSEFYQKNANAVAVIAAVILEACIQVLLTGTVGNQYSDTQTMLFFVCAMEGLSLFFSNLIMMVFSLETGSSKHAAHFSSCNLVDTN